jgi:hypothetical protein
MLWRQGDVFIQAIKRIPAESRSSPMPHGTLVHGELTGHSHRLASLDGATVFAGNAPGELFVEVTGDDARVIHEEHATIMLPQGLFRVWRQREYSPEAIRIVVD